MNGLTQIYHAGGDTSSQLNWRNRSPAPQDRQHTPHSTAPKKDSCSALINPKAVYVYVPSSCPSNAKPSSVLSQVEAHITETGSPISAIAKMLDAAGWSGGRTSSLSPLKRIQSPQAHRYSKHLLVKCSSSQQKRLLSLSLKKVSAHCKMVRVKHAGF